MEAVSISDVHGDRQDLTVESSGITPASAALPVLMDGCSWIWLEPSTNKLVPGAESVGLVDPRSFNLATSASRT
jgi:hypothetical protein